MSQPDDDDERQPGDGAAGDEQERPWLANPVSDEGVDLSQIRALRAMTPSQRARALKQAANALLRLRRHARRV